MKKVYFVTTADARYGFSLAGMKQITAAPEEAEGLLRKLMFEHDTGLVIIDEKLMQNISGDRLREMEKRWYGVLLVLPSPEKTAVEDYVLKLVKRAIGYHVRLSA